MPEQNLAEPSPVGSGAGPSRPPVLFAQTQRLIREMEAEIQEALVTYWNSASGSICNNDVPGLYGVLRDMRPCPRPSLFIKSDGGSGQALLRMIADRLERRASAGPGSGRLFRQGP